MQNFDFIPSDDALRRAMERCMSIRDGQEQFSGEAPGFLGKLGNSGLAILEGIGFIPGTAWDTAQDAIWGFDPADRDELHQREERDRELAAYQQKYAGKAFEGVTDAMGSLGYSLTTMGAGLAGGLAGGFAGSAAGPAGTVAGAAAGNAAFSGGVAYRAATADMERLLYGEAAKALGREPSADEWEVIRGEFISEIRKYGAWEAIPEAVSNALMAKILGPLGKKVFTGGIKGAVKKIGGLYGEELATETTTQWGQGSVLADAGLTEKAPGVAESFMEIAPATLWQTTLMAGGKKAVDVAARRLRGRAEDVGIHPGQGEGSTPPPASTETQWISEQDVTPAAPYVFEQSPENMPVPASPGEFISEADMADIDAFVRDYEAREQAQADVLMLSEYGRPEGQRFTPILPALEAGESVDLLGLPQRVGVRTARGLGGMAALPEGTGAIPMGGESTGRGPIAPATDFSTPVATPYRQRMELPFGGREDVMPGAWAGLSSQRASAAPQFAGGQPIEMARGIGGIWNAAPSVKPSAMSGTMTGPMAEQVPGAMEGTAAPVREAYRPTPQQEAKWARIEEAAHVQDARDATRMEADAKRREEAAQWLRERARRMREERRGQNADTFLRDHVIVGTIPGQTQKREDVVPVSDNANPADSSRGHSSAIPELMRQDAQNSRENPSEQSPRTGMQEPEVLRPGTTWEQTFAEAQKMPRSTLVDILSQRAIRSQRPDSARLAVAKYKKMPKSRLVEELADEIHGLPERTYKENTVFRVKGFTPQEFRKFMGSESGTKEEFLDYIQKNLEPDDGSALTSIKRDYLKWRRQGTTGQAAIKPSRADEWGLSADVANKVESERTQGGKIAASEAEGDMVKSDPQAVETKQNAVKSKETSHAQTDAQGPGVDDSGSDEEQGTEYVSRAEGKRGAGRSRSDAGSRHRGKLRGDDERHSESSQSDGVQGSAGESAAPDNGEQYSLGDSPEHGAGVHGYGEGRGGRGRRGRKPDSGDARTVRGGERRGHGEREGDGSTASGLNYNAPVGALARTGSWKETAARNLDIIELSKRIDAEKRVATPEEQALLAQYVGWGPSDIRNRLFPSTNGSRREINPYAVSPDWRPLAERAAEILSPEEVTTAFQSTQYAHYTSEPMIRAIWSGLQRLGFKGGNILEPGMGTGLFAVASPSEVMEKSKYTGVEMDKATARIARHLLPESNILNADFVKQKFPDNFFDLAIGNPPFSSTKILDDPAYKKYRFLLHDYFFAKSLDKVRPGGLLVFVTSKGTMDKADDKARAYMAERADLLGAIRLPQTAFKQNAGTEVVTDVLFLRKRQPGEVPGGESWQGRAEVQTPEGPALVNEYFARHPDMVLGEHSLKGSMYRSDEYTVLPHGTDIDAQFAEAVTHLPENVYSPDISSSADSMRQQVMERDFNPRHTKEGALYVDEKGLLRRLDDGSGVDIDTVAKLSDADKEWLKGYVELRDALKQAQYDQLQDRDWEVSLKKLNQFYDSFVKRYGFIREFKEVERTTKNKDGEDVTTSSRRYKRKRLFDLDVEAPLIEQLEKVMDDGRIVKAEFLKGRTIKRPATPQIKNTNDALMVSLDQRGILDLDHVAELAGKSRDAVIRELGDTVYEVPGADWQMADEYLSGDVVTKLEEAEAAAASDKRFRRNVEALRKVQPKPLEAKNISVGLGAPWIPTEHLDVFAREILGLNLHIRYNKDSGTFSVPDANRRSARSGTSEWGTPDRSPQEILSAVLNNQSITIRVKDAQGKTHTDATATTEANEKADKMRKAFESWIWQDAKRTGELVKIYNRTFNNIAPRRFDGSHLTLPGLSLRYKLYDHQKRAIWRIIQTGNVYLAHAVGAGKTLEMIVSGMEQRRLGLIQRPMYVVPNHMLRQFSSEFQDAYPLARIMVADEENFTGANRRRFVAQAALNAPDAIVITHSAFKRIGTRPETMEAVTKDLLTQLEEAIKDSTDRISRSRLEQRLEQAKRRAEARFSKAKDQAVFFEDMGVDFLYVDEAHGFRKLDFVTNRDRVKGIDPSGSEMALDLYSKLEWLRKEHPGRSHVLASGTPVTNTMAELYTVMRYMDPDGLERDGLSSFDAWATMFGRVKADLEQNASGSYENVERFAKFVNVPELMKRVRGFMDVLTMSQLGDLVKRPDLKTGQPVNVVAQASPAVQDYLKNVLAPRIEKSKKWRPSAQEKGNPDPIVKIITDGRLAALDLRFVSELAENDPDSKLNLMIDDIIKTHHSIADREYINPETGAADPVKGGTQIVFSSVGFGEQVAARRGFDLRAFMMRRFKEGGISASQVAWMGDYKTHAKKEAMFKEMRAGKIRLLIGSPQNMGTGVNVQKRLFKLHYLSPPWYPADVEQPHGRILRQGNQNPEVEINWYATKGTYDSTMWGMVARKARFIEQAFTGDDSVRTLDDISESSQYEMAAALAAGDERAIQLAGLNADIERLSRLERAHAEEQMRFRGRRRDIEHALEREADERAKLQTALDTLGGENVSTDNFRLVIGKKEYTKQKEAGEALLTAAEKELARWTPGGAKARESISIGSAQGKCPLVLHMDVGETGGRIGKRLRSLEVKIGRLNLEVQDFIRDDASAQGIATRLVNRLNGITRSISESKTRENALRREMESLQGRIGVPFPQEGELNEKIAEAARIQAELEEEGKKQAEAEQTEEKEDTEDRASIMPGEFLPSRRKTRLHLRPAAVQRVVNALGKTAKNAAPVRVVQTAEELPARVREMFADQLDAIEGIYDPASGVVWMVADNISDMGRAAEVWAHEQVGHHGLRGLFSDGERRRMLNSLWLSMGGMGNETIRRVAEEYGLKPRTVDADRQTVMEEVIAHLAEKRQGGRLDAKEQNLWRKIVNAVLRAWKKVMNAVSGREGRMAHENIDALLADLGSFVWEGRGAREAFGFGQSGAGVFAAKRGEAEETVRYQKARSKDSPNDLVLLPDGSADFGVMPETKLRDGRVLKGAPIRLQRGISRFGGGYGYEHINDVHGDEIRDAGYPGVQAFVWDLVHNYNQIWQESNGALRFVKEAGSGRSAGFVRLTRRGDFYEIRSAFPMVNSPSVRGGKLLWAGDPHQSTATEEQNPFVTKSDRLAPTARTGSEGSLRSQRGQSNEKSIMQVRDADKPLASLSKKSDRENLNELISEWNRRTGLKKEVLLRQLRDYFNVKSIDEIPGKWKGDAEAFVQEKIRDIPDPDKAGFLDRLITLDMRKTAALTDVPEIRSFFHEKDLGMMSNFLSLPHWIAKRIPAFAKVYERQLRRMDERSAALKNSLEQVPSLFGKNRMGKKDMESLGKILWETEGKEPKELEGVEKFLTSDKLANGRELIEINPDFYKAYEKWVSGLNGTEAAKKALVEVRKSLDNDLASAHNRMAAMSELSDDAIKQFRQDIGHIPNYFPHHRYGKYFVQAKVGDEVVFRQHFDAATKARAMLEAKRIAAEQAKNFPGATWSRGDNVRLPDEVLGAPIDTEAMEQIIRAATAKITDKGHAKEIAELLMEGTADVLKARGWGEHGIRRKGVPGFERKDLARILYDYKAGLNGWLTKMEAARDFGDALREIDASQTPRLWKYASQYVRDMLRNRDDIDRMTGMIKSVAFAWYMGGSIKTAMVNLTQNIVVGIPRLQMDVTGGAGAWIRGAHKAIAHRVTGSRSGLLAEEEARLLHELDGENVITDAYMEEIRGQLGSTPQNLWNRFTKVLGWPMSEVERFNRASLALAAFRAARAGQMKPHARVKYGVRGKASYEQAKSFAADVVKDAHFVYGKSNTPEFLRSNAAGRAAGSMFTFRSFTFNMLGMWLWALRTQGREGAVFAAKSLGATMALGGVTALPFYATAMALCQMMSGDDDDWTEQIRQSLPQNNLLRDMVCYGMPSMAGINIGGSLQMETGLTRGLQRGVTPKEILAESFGDIIGIPYDLAIEKTSKVMEASRHGDVWRMVEEAAPVALKNTMQAWRLMTEGQTAMSGRPINNPGEHGARKLTGAEAVGKALGFQPVSSTKSYAAYAARQHAEKVKGDMLDELAVLALRSHDTGTPDGKLEMRKRMRVWNAKMEAEGKPDMIIREKDVIRRVKARRRENRVTPKAMRERERQQAVWG